MNRRGFLGALAGLPIAAVVQPKVSVPEVAAPPIRTIGYHEVLRAGVMTPSEVRRREELTVTISCDTTEIQREVARAQRVIAATERRLKRALHRGITVITVERT